MRRCTAFLSALVFFLGLGELVRGGGNVQKTESGSSVMAFGKTPTASRSSCTPSPTPRA